MSITLAMGIDWLYAFPPSPHLFSFPPSPSPPLPSIQYNISDEDYFGNYFQYVLISVVGNLQTLRTPVDKNV